MRLKPLAIVPAALLGMTGISFAQSGPKKNYTNFILQIQDSGPMSQYDVPPSGTDLAPMAMDGGGATFELHTLRTDLGPNPKSQLLVSKYVAPLAPSVTGFRITSKDPFQSPPRTRADEPFSVEFTVSGLTAGENLQEAAKKVLLKRHTLFYGENGDGTSVDRGQASLHSQVYIEQNGLIGPSVHSTEIVASPRIKIRGEERFSVYALPDLQMDKEKELGSVVVQVWPVAEGTISGIKTGDTIRLDTPTITISLTDLYPDSKTFVRAYPEGGNPDTDSVTVKPEVVHYGTKPGYEVVPLDSWDELLATDGKWVLQLLTITPFGITELDTKSVTLDRSLRVRGTLTSQ